MPDEVPIRDQIAGLMAHMEVEALGSPQIVRTGTGTYQISLDTSGWSTVSKKLMVVPWLARRL